MDEARPPLLFLSQTLPYPPDGGVKLRTFNVLRQLAVEFDVTALCFYRRRTTPDVATAVAGLLPYARVQAFPIPQETNRARLLADHAASVLSRVAYTQFTYRHGDAVRAVRRLVDTAGFRLAHVDSLDLCAYLPLLQDVPVACTHHNVESDLLRRAASTERSRLRAAYLRHQGDLLERLERRWCPQVRLNVAVSDRDADRLRELAPDGAFHVAPNGVDTTYFAPVHCEQRGLVFVGGASWFPNVDAMRYMADAILPRIRAVQPDVPMRWVGRISPERASWARTNGIEPLGYVDDVRPHVAAAAVVAAPLRIGGGTRLKILDAWSMGKAVVSTRVGAEGLAVEEDGNIVVRDRPEEFADACCALLADPERRAAVGARARATAVASYEWNGIGARLRAVYHAIAANDGA